MSGLELNVIPIAITVSPEVAKILAENHVDLFEALNKDQAIMGQLRRGRLAVEQRLPEQSGSRFDPLTVLAATALTTAVGGAIERILRVLLRKPIITTSRRWEPKLDPKGKPVLLDNGEPVYAWSEEQQYVEPKPFDPLRMTIANTTKGLALSIGAAPPSGNKT
jgi:hypothetical protein